jgi:hypothetical protein
LVNNLRHKNAHLFLILKSLNDLSTVTSMYKADLFMQGMNFYITGVDHIKKGA